MSKILTYLQGFSTEELESNFEDIARQGIELEIKNIQTPTFEREPIVLNTNDGFISYNSSENLIKCFNEYLEKPFAEVESVIENFRDRFIHKALKINRINKIYNNLKAGVDYEPQYYEYNENTKLLQKFTYYSNKLSVIELIKFEIFLDNYSTKPKSIEKSIEDYFINLNDKEDFLREFKNLTKGNKGIVIRGIIEYFKDENVLHIAHREDSEFYRTLNQFFNRDIGSYNSIFNPQEYKYLEHKIKAIPLFSSLIEKHKQ